MAMRSQVIKRRLEMLALAGQLNNVSMACKLSGISRSHFYRIKKAYETRGEAGLVPRASVRSARTMDIIPEMEHVILLMTEQHPTVPYTRLVTRMRFDGIKVSPALVRMVWQKHGLTRRAARVAWIGRQQLSHKGAPWEGSPNQTHSLEAVPRTPEALPT